MLSIIVLSFFRQSLFSRIKFIKEEGRVKTAFFVLLINE